MLLVSNSKIVYLLNSWVEGFNDCACCPLSLECDDEEKTDCENKLKKWLTEFDE